MQTYMKEETYLLAQIDSIQFAIPASQVLNISRLPRVKKIPNADPSIAGTIRFRDTVISVIELRHFLGYETLSHQSSEMGLILEARKKDHIEWLNKLEYCINTGEEFTLQTDPTKCNFGKWFYSFKTKNKTLELLLSRFEQPHNAIHNVAQIALDLVGKGQKEQAIALVNEKKDKELKTMINLFDEFDKAYSELNRSLVVVLWAGSQTIGFCVDSVSSVQRLKPLSQDEGLDLNVSNALKEYGEHLFINDNNIVYELQPERVSEIVTGVY